MEQNNPTIEIPAWLTEEFIQDILEKGKDYQVKIKEMKVDMPVPKGNNYATDIYGVKVDYRRSNDLNKIRKQSLILKVPIKGPAYEMLVKSGFLEKEPIVYNEYLPKVRAILGHNDDDDDDEIDNEECFTAKSYPSSEENVVILEDLKVKGYRMVNRVNQLDYEHCLLALKSLAKFHATSVILYEKDPKFVEKIGKEVLFCDSFKETYSSFIGISFGILINKLKSYQGFQKYSHWFEESLPNMSDKIQEEIRPKDDEFNVLNHGDFWLTNMLFKYDSDMKPINNILIDLQACRYGSPAIDLVYFIDSSAQEHARTERLNDLITYYVKELNSNLERYGSAKRLEEAELKKSIRNLTNYRLTVVTNVLSIVLADPNKTKFMDMKETKVEDWQNVENNPFETYLTNEKFLKALAARMEQFEEDGLLKQIKPESREEERKLEIPTWLTKEYIQKALEHGKEYSVIVEDMEINMPVPKGNNYATDIYGVKIEYRKSNDLNNLRKRSVILKVPIKGPMYEMFIESGFIQKEPLIYSTLAPKLKSIFGENDDDDEDDDEGNKDENLLAKSYFSTEDSVVILEDLKIKGYKMVEREKQLDYAHCIVALKALAKFHAGSVVLLENEPELAKTVGKEIMFLSEFKETYSGFVAGNFEMVGKNLKKYPEIENYADWLVDNYDKAWDKIVDELSSKDNEFNVLNHGDYWLTNMLFKYDSENQPIKNIPLDLQCCRYTSPAVDFLYFIDSSASEQVRDDRFNNLVIEYLKELNTILERYGSTKRLDESVFNKSISNLKYFRLYVNVGILPFVIANPNEVTLLDLSECTVENMNNKENNPFESYLKSDRLLKTLKKRFLKESLIPI